MSQNSPTASVKRSRALSHVNATRIKSFEQIDEAVGEFCDIFGLGQPSQVVVGVRVDSCTASGHFAVDNAFKTLDLSLINTLLNDGSSTSSSPCRARINPRFPSRVICRFEKPLGSLILFSSGKFNCLGARCPDRPPVHARIRQVDNPVRMCEHLVQTVGDRKSVV